MLGLKKVAMNKLTTAFMAVSAAMIVFALALAPADNASIATFVIWIGGALALIGLWCAVAVEAVRRFFGEAGGSDTPRKN